MSIIINLNIICNAYGARDKTRQYKKVQRYSAGVQVKSNRKQKLYNIIDRLEIKLDGTKLGRN